MTVSELIKLLKRHDPNAVVAMRYAYIDPAGFVTCEALQREYVQAVQLRHLQSRDAWFEPMAGTQLYMLCEGDDEAIADAVSGVRLG